MSGPRWGNIIQRVELFPDNLVLDCPVAPKFLNILPNKNDREFTYMRYTVATCDPSRFQSEKFMLRQVLFEQPRATEMLISITLSDEDDVTFARTLHGVMKNIAYLCLRSRSKVWGRDSLRKIAVCIVAGRKKFAILPLRLTLELILAYWLCLPLSGYIKMASQRWRLMAK